MVREFALLGRPRVGISACLLGEHVRYDGGHKRQSATLAFFEGRIDWVGVCPEVELGLGAPRETIQLERHDGAIRLIATETRRDLTEAMDEWAAGRLRELDELGISGYVFKARSPSCGLGSTTVLDQAEPGSGVFAAAFGRAFPGCPAVEETDLADEASRGRFLRLVVARYRLQRLFQPGWRLADLVEFHSRHKLLLMAYSPEAYAALGRLVADAASVAVEEYSTKFQNAFAEEASPGRHANALLHAAGYFTQEMERGERQELLEAIEALRQGAGDLVWCKRRIRGEAADRGYDYLTDQIYLENDPWLTAPDGPTREESRVRD